MMSALLMGVNRAYPYAKLELEKVSDHINTIYRIVHIANFNVALHALQLLYQVSDFSNNINDRLVYTTKNFYFTQHFDFVAAFILHYIKNWRILV